MTVLISQLDMRAIRDHFLERERVHHTLRQHFDDNATHEFVQLALGISDPSGNYSASEHGLGPRILANSTKEDVFEFAEFIDDLASAHHLPEAIYKQAIPSLKISVGTEMAMMLRPTERWVGNIRTIWAHLLIKHDWDLSRANDELRFYRAGDHDSEIHYALWRDMYLALDTYMQQLNQLAIEAANEQSVKPGHIPYMWADAVASALYTKYASSKL